MQKITISILIAGFVALVSTFLLNNGDCPPSKPLAFKIIDHQTGKNLFTNGKYSIDKLRLTYIEDNTEKEVKLKFFQNDQNEVIVFSPDLANKCIDHHRFFMYFDSVGADTIDIVVKDAPGKKRNIYAESVLHNGKQAKALGNTHGKHRDQIFVIAK